MTASLRIRSRDTEKGEKRYTVLYRLGGRGYAEMSAGTFQVLTHARKRQALVGDWLAEGKNPKVELAKAFAPPPPIRDTRSFADELLRARISLSPKTRSNYEAAFRQFLPTFGARDPHTITWRELQVWVASLQQGDEPLAAGTVHQYLSKVRQLFDFADVDPNPARDRRLEKPRLVTEEPHPPTRREFHAVLDHLPSQVGLVLRLIEATALRVGEATALLWGDVDTLDARLRISVTRTKGRSGGQRWAQVPRLLLDELELLCPLEDRVRERRIFSVGVHEVQKRLKWACTVSGVAAFTPHDLRHRRLSLWHAQGVPMRVIQDRAGHSDLSTTQDVYTHIVIDARDDDWIGGES
jgi:integrase